jgi:hypothetical protein
MRRTYISPEFDYERTFGTFNMIEIPSLFSSKMLEIEDEIDLHDQYLVYYQNSLSEQIDIAVESSSAPVIYSLVDDKKNNSNLLIDDTQNSFQRNVYTRWILTISLKTIFLNYLFGVLKESRTFEGIRNGMTSQKSVDTSIREYIDKNVFNRYRFDSVKLYIKYNDLRRQIALRYKNNWASNVNQIYNEHNRLKKIETQTSFDYTNLKINFGQEKTSELYNFDYYFTTLWKKI